MAWVWQKSSRKTKPPPERQGFLKVARLTGLEPATPGVTGRYSNQLSYNRAVGAIYAIHLPASSTKRPEICAMQVKNYPPFAARLCRAANTASVAR